MDFKKIVKLYILIGLIFVFSACSKEVVNNEDEILMARDCGLDNFQCCDGEPACLFGQECCVDPNNIMRNYCSASCDFGNQYNYCLPDNKCNDDFACLNGYCEKIRGDGDFCDPTDNGCDFGLVCFENTCVECGKLSNPCCDEKECFSSKKGSVQCVNDKCLLCGIDGGEACLDGRRCGFGTIYNNGNCLKCGGYNKPCCNDESGVGYKCDLENDLICKLGFCSRIEILE